MSELPEHRYTAMAGDDNSAVVEVVLADGIWCHDCEYFETVDSIVGARCMGCGCHSEVHVACKVVRT